MIHSTPPTASLRPSPKRLKPMIVIPRAAPGKIKGQPTPEQLWWTREGYKEYLELVHQYKKEGL